MLTYIGPKNKRYLDRLIDRGEEEFIPCRDTTINQLDMQQQQKKEKKKKIRY